MGDGPINVAASGKRKTRKKTVGTHPYYIVEARIGGTYLLMKEY
jgi:hypothetical protein